MIPGSMASAAAGRQRAGECFKCGQTGHWGNACTVPRDQWKTQPRPAADAACFNCGQKGHVSRDCTAPRKPWDPQRAPGSAAAGAAAGSVAGDAKSGDENDVPAETGCSPASRVHARHRLPTGPACMQCTLAHCKYKQAIFTVAL